MNTADRRKARRVEASLPITIAGGPEPAEGRTLNLSTNGVYFESPRRIETLTRVRMQLSVPVHERGVEKEISVPFDGVIVRVEPETTDTAATKYRIAVFFTHVPKTSQNVLDGFIKRRLSE